MAAVAGSGPSHVVPAAQTLAEDGSLVFSAANGNAVTVSDGVAGDNRLRVSLTVTPGILTLSQTTGLTVVSGANGSTGIALVELYDAGTSATGRLVNVSARSQAPRNSPRGCAAHSAITRAKAWRPRWSTLSKSSPPCAA